ncbi:hypothetical protein D3C75_1375840 [compost metagenome]
MLKNNRPLRPDVYLFIRVTLLIIHLWLVYPNRSGKLLQNGKGALMITPEQIRAVPISLSMAF